MAASSRWLLLAFSLTLSARASSFQYRYPDYIDEKYRPAYHMVPGDRERIRFINSVPITKISLERPGCYSGLCGVYKVTFYKRGAAIYEGRRNAERVGKFIGKVSLQDYGKLCHLLEKLDFQSFRDAYVSPELHGKTVTIRVELKDSTEKVILDYGLWEPVELWTLQKTIDALTHETTWKDMDESSLVGALEFGDADWVRAAIAHGADVNIELEHGLTPLMFAALEGQASVVRVLLESGVDVKATMEGGINALLVAVQGGDAETVGLLLEAGAKPPSNPEYGVIFLGLRGFVWVENCISG